jgi:hypothetical protein
MALPDLSVQEAAVPYNYSVLDLTQNTEESVTVTLVNRQGVDYNFDNTVYEATFYSKEFPLDSSYYLEIDCTINADGTITVPFADSDLTIPGVWHGEFAIATIADPDTVTTRVKCYVNIEPTITASSQDYDPLVLSDVRIAVRDRGADDNVLLDAEEWSDAEIVYSIVRAVGMWNESDPINSTFTYTQITFPYKENLIDGVLGELLHMAALNLSRNRMPSVAGGITVDDKQRAELYLQLSNQYRNKYKDWMVGKKGALNIDSMYGATYNPYFS